MNRGADASSSRMPALDGLRGIAILAVMLFHFRWIFVNGSDRFSQFMYAGLGFGWMGVDLFFALSGFLITGILLDTRESTSYFRTFYGRRALRIFPLYYGTLIVILGACPFIAQSLGHNNLWSHVNSLWYLFYVANWQPGTHGLIDPMVGHFWSLCVEEQFYLVWPAVVWLTPTRWLPSLALILVGLSALLRVSLVQSGAGGEVLYRITLTRMDPLALGALAAMAYRRLSMGRWIRSRARLLISLSLALVLVTVLVQHGFDPDSGPMQLVGYIFLAILFATVVFLATNASGTLKSALTWRPLTIAGAFSYAMYVFHIPIERVVRPEIDRIAASLPLVAGLVVRTLYVIGMIALMFGVGWLSWNLFEKRVLALKRYFNYEPTEPRAIESSPDPSGASVFAASRANISR